MGNCVNSKSIDNRVSVFILIEVLRALKDQEVPYDIYGVFTVQEEVGLAWSHCSSAFNQSGFWVWLGCTTIAFDVPGSQKHEQVTALGKGCCNQNHGWFNDLRLQNGTII